MEKSHYSALAGEGRGPGIPRPGYSGGRDYLKTSVCDAVAEVGEAEVDTMIRSQRYEKALAIYEIVDQIKPRNMEFYIHWAYALIEFGKVKEGLAKYNIATDMLLKDIELYPPDVSQETWEKYDFITQNVINSNKTHD